ncbi:MAG: hypothetical protein AVDCRST_MAG88-2320, partial [uncultured Thermomicrobiales bacterium]
GTARRGRLLDCRARPLPRGHGGLVAHPRRSDRLQSRAVGGLSARPARAAPRGGSRNRAGRRGRAASRGQAATPARSRPTNGPL